MPFNAAGIFQRLHNWTRDVSEGNTTVLAARVDADSDDIADGIEKVNSGAAARTGPIRHSDGTAAAPAITFTAETSTGLYRLPGGGAGISVDGNLIAAINGKVALTDGTMITPDFGMGNFFEVTIGANRTLNAPTGPKAGQAGTIIIKQNATGGHALAFNDAWKFAGGGTPTLAQGAGAVNMLGYLVITPEVIAANLISGLA